MRNWNAKDVVAVIMAMAIFVSLTGFIVSRMLHPENVSIESASLVADLLKVISGGLIGWIAGRSGNNNKETKGEK